ncbi:MAG TPA: hypothetical protein VHD87_14905 [Acidimicrobiales bacterium]|nr:hypothetical protein [Acidimicrobiales bacterium]
MLANAAALLGPRVAAVVAAVDAVALGLLAVLRGVANPYPLSGTLFYGCASAYFAVKAVRVFRDPQAGGPDALGTPLGAAALSALAIDAGFPAFFVVPLAFGYLASIRQRSVSVATRPS